MKKLVYTLSFVAAVSFAGKAQSHDAKQDPKKPQSAQSVTPVTVDQNVNMNPAPAPADNGPSRMAITQKGVPASKAKDNKDTKDNKATEPKGQPTTTEKH